MSTVSKGLAGVVVEQTAISDVRAEGILSYRGRRIEDLVNLPFYQVAAWVVSERLDDHLQDLLQPSLNLDEREAALVLALPADLHPMQVLQGVVPLLSRREDIGYGEADQGLHVAAKLPAVVATHLRRAPVRMATDVGYAEAFLRAIGNPCSDAHVQAFNTAQVLQIEHSLNAGTFAARVVASTLAAVESAIAAGLGALSGPLHGGADEAALAIADSVADPIAARRLVEDVLRDGGKIPGMGHREYRAVDPRALCLQDWIERLVLGTEHEGSYLKLRQIEQTFAAAMRERGKPLYPNVDFYKGLVLRVLGLPNHFFTATFAMARVFGYVAHFIESRQDNRIYRPAAEYVGPPIDTGPLAATR